MTKSVLVLYATKSRTGNQTTCARIANQLKSNGFLSVGCHIDDLMDGARKPFADWEQISCILALHAYRCSDILKCTKIPFLIIFGGTDLNRDATDPVKLAAMSEVVVKARWLVCFSQAMLSIAASLWPSQAPRLVLQPQGVQTCLMDDPCSLYEQLKSVPGFSFPPLPCDAVVFLLVAGLRAIKDPLFVAESVECWHDDDPRIFLLIVGPEVDVNFASSVRQLVSRMKSVILCPAVPQTQLHKIMSRCAALVNSSHCEGMCGTILEAMHLGLPVLARYNAGNAALVSHEDTGIIFRTPTEFVFEAKKLLADRNHRCRLVDNARVYVSEHHSWHSECETYCRLVREMKQSGKNS